MIIPNEKWLLTCKDYELPMSNLHRIKRHIVMIRKITIT